MTSVGVQVRAGLNEDASACQMQTFLYNITVCHAQSCRFSCHYGKNVHAGLPGFLFYIKGEIFKKSACRILGAYGRWSRIYASLQQWVPTCLNGLSCFILYLCSRGYCNFPCKLTGLPGYSFIAWFYNVKLIIGLQPKSYWNEKSQLSSFIIQ